MESNHLATAHLNKAYRVTAGKWEHTPYSLVPREGNAPSINDYQSFVILFNYPGIESTLWSR